MNTPSTGASSSRTARAALVLAIDSFLLAAIAAGPPIANAARKVANADKVDGLHAVKAKAPIAKRKKKLVATNKRGFLPNNIIKKAPNADRLDGLDSTAFARRADLLPPGQVTRLTWDGVQTVAGNGTPKLVRTIGDFTKHHDDTVVRLDLNTHVVGSGGTAEYCQFHVTVLPADAPVILPPAFGEPDSILAGGHTDAFTPVVGSRTISNLAAGDYTARLYVRSPVGQNCMENPGNYDRRLTVTEFAANG